jgi:hypothetical protein
MSEASKRYQSGFDAAIEVAAADVKDSHCIQTTRCRHECRRGPQECVRHICYATARSGVSRCSVLSRAVRAHSSRTNSVQSCSLQLRC